MPSRATSTLADVLKLLFVGLVIFYVVYIIKIPIVCAGCDPLVGVWYRCMAGTGIGTTTCDIDQSGSYAFSWSILSDLNKILADSGLTNLPKQWLQAIINLWVTIKGFAQTVVDQTVSLYKVVKQEFTKIINEYIIGYPVAGWEAFKSNVIIPIITGVTNYVINPVKNLIQQVVDFKGTALDVLRSTVSTIKGVGDTIYEYTYGFLVDGFDQIPYGLVLFVQGIQNLLNMLKHGVITFANTGLNFGIDAVNFISNTAMQAAKGAMIGTQFAVDNISSGLNAATSWMISNAVTPLVNGLNGALHYDFGIPIKTGVDTLAGGVQAGVNGLVSAVQDGTNFIIGGVKTAVNGTLSVAEAAVNGTLGGVESGVNFVIDGVRYGVEGIVEGINIMYNDGIIDYIVNPIIEASNVVVDKVNEWIIKNINIVANQLASISTVNVGYAIFDILNGVSDSLMADSWKQYMSWQPFWWAGGIGQISTVARIPLQQKYDKTNNKYNGPVPIPRIENISIGSVSLGSINPDPVSIRRITIPPANIGNLRISNDPNTIGSISPDALEINVPNFSNSANETISNWQVATRLNNDVISEPSDLFWAGSRQIRYGDSKYPSGSACSLIAKSYQPGSDPNVNYGNAPNTSIYDQFNTSTCMFSSMVSVTNNYIGQQSCSDVCYAYGQQSYDSLDTTTSGCGNAFTIYGTPEENSIQTMTTPGGLPIYIYKNQACYYFAPKLYKLDMTLDFNTFTTVNNKRFYSVTENLRIILESEKKYFVPVQNGGYRDTRTNAYYVIPTPLSTFGAAKAWRYYINNLTDSTTTCDKEILLPGTPESLGITSSYNEVGIKVYTIDEKPYVYINPKLLRLTPTLIEVSLNQLNNATTAYSYNSPYIDGKPNQIAYKYTQKGFVLNLANTVPLPTQVINNTNVTYSPQQAGYIFNSSASLGIQYYTHPSYQSKNFIYDKVNGKMIEVNLSSNVVSIVGTPRSNGYTQSTIVSNGFTNSNGTYVFGIVDQSQYFIVMKQVGYEILPQSKVALNYTITGGNVIYNTPEQQGFVVQPADSYGLIRYLKNSVYYIFDSNANVMVPLNESTPSKTIYGNPDSELNQYTKQLTGYKKNDSTYFFVVNQRYLSEYYAKSLFNTSCSCYTSKVVSKTCKDFCASNKDDTGANYGCDNSATSAITGGLGCNDSRVTDFTKCVCTEQGPVNIVVKPMQEYNPFRLVKNAVSSGVDQLTSVIKYAIQSFLTPIWNTIKYIIQFMSSLVWSAIQFVYLWFTTGPENPIISQIKDFLGTIKNGFNEYVVQRFIKDIVIGGIKSIIPTKAMLMSIITPVVDFFKVAFRAMLDAFKTAFDAVKNALKYFFFDLLPKVLAYVLSALIIVVDKATFFIPISKTNKLFILMALGLLSLIFYFTGYSLQYVIKAVDKLLYMIFFTFSTAYNLITGG